MSQNETEDKSSAHEKALLIHHLNNPKWTEHGMPIMIRSWNIRSMESRPFHGYLKMVEDDFAIQYEDHKTSMHFRAFADGTLADPKGINTQHVLSIKHSGYIRTWHRYSNVVYDH